MSMLQTMCCQMILRSAAHGTVHASWLNTCDNLGCLMGCDILLYSVVVPGISSQPGILIYKAKLTCKACDMQTLVLNVPVAWSDHSIVDPKHVTCLYYCQ